jgi:hypothetical protein
MKVPGDMLYSGAGPCMLAADAGDESCIRCVGFGLLGSDTLRCGFEKFLSEFEFGRGKDGEGWVLGGIVLGRYDTGKPVTVTGVG